MPLFLAVDATPVVPNIEYLGRGYDLIFGEPLHSGDKGDPGFKASLYRFDYGYKSMDGRWVVPNGTEVSGHFWNTTSERTIRWSDDSLREVLESRVHLHLFYGVSRSLRDFGAFAANKDYRRMKSKLAEGTRFDMESELVDQFVGILSIFVGPEFSVSFKQAVEAYVEDKICEEVLVSQFGTHFVTQVVTGARRTQITQRTTTNVATRTYETGVCHQANTAAWAEMAAKFPMPIEFWLTPVSDLMKPLRFPNLDEQKLQAAHDRLEGYVAGRCEKLRLEGVVEACDLFEK